mmetsp:Transcript_395/g.467  ORF Transcript_395/g.467 Transcript_395/m.467 type:complete len:140 (-) Transcript_395:341-760(-)
MALGPWRGRGSRPPSSRSKCQTENHVLMVLDGAENHVLGRQMAVDIRHLDKWQSDRFFFALVVRTSGIGFLQIKINGRWSLFERSSECYRCITWRDGQMRSGGRSQCCFSMAREACKSKAKAQYCGQESTLSCDLCGGL